MELAFIFFFQAEDGIRDKLVTGVQTCALPISARERERGRRVGLARTQGSERHLRPRSQRFAPRGLAHWTNESAHLRAELAQLLGPLQRRHASTPSTSTSRCHAAPAPAASQPGPVSRNRRGAITRAPAPRASAAHSSAARASGSENTANDPPA